VIELAMIMPVFIAFVFGCIEFGLIMWGRISMEYAISQTARYAYVNNTASNTVISNFAQTMVPSAYGSNLVFSFTVNMVAHSTATITGTYVYNFFVLPLPPITMTSQVIQPIP